MDSSTIAALIDVGSQWQSNLLNLGYNELNYWRSRRQEERLWNREDTAVQRRVEDLKKAGLNPLLAAGSPASSGMVSQHYGNPNFNINMGELMDVVKNNYEAIKDQQVAQADLLEKESVKREAEIELINSQKVEAEAKTLEAISRAKNVDIKTQTDAYNLDKYQEAGIPTTASSFGKIGVDILGLETGNIVQEYRKYIKDSIGESVNKIRKKFKSVGENLKSSWNRFKDKNVMDSNKFENFMKSRYN